MNDKTPPVYAIRPFVGKLVILSKTLNSILVYDMVFDSRELAAWYVKQLENSLLRELIETGFK